LVAHMDLNLNINRWQISEVDYTTEVIRRA
jgi:hypothetical protein